MPHQLSIVIVTFNCRDLVARCLEMVPAAAGDLACEVIVVDNASRDGTPVAIAERFPWVRLVASAENLGFSAGNNRGLARADGRYVVFLNPDTEPERGSLAHLIALLEADATLGMVGPRLLNADGSLQPSVRGFPTFGVALIVLTKLYRVLRFLPAVRRYDVRDLDYDRSQDVDQLMGACLAMPRAVLDRVGVFDERFWMWFDEVDLCLRVKQAGWRIRYVADARVLHRLNQSSLQLHSVFAQQRYARSLVAYFEKHHPAWQAWLLRSVGWIGVTAAHVIQGLRRLTRPRSRDYRLTARDAGVSTGDK